MRRRLRCACALYCCICSSLGQGPINFGNASNASIGQVYFPYSEVRVSEKDKLAFVALERTGGSQGPIIAVVKVDDSSSTTAVQGKDFFMTGAGTITWLPGEEGVKAIVLRIHDDDVWSAAKVIKFSLDVFPQAAKASQSIESYLYIEDDGDAGELVFSPSPQRLYETAPLYPRPEEESCIFYVTRAGGSSGRVELGINLSFEFCGHTKDPQREESQVDISEYADYGILYVDFSWFPLKSPMIWEDGEVGSKCAIKELSWYETPAANQGGFHFWPDAEVELTDLVCFRPYLVQNSSVKLSTQEALVIASRDAGRNGGGALSCTKGSHCLLSFDQTMADAGDPGVWVQGENCKNFTLGNPFAVKLASLGVDGAGQDQVPCNCTNDSLQVDFGFQHDHVTPGVVSFCLMPAWIANLPDWFNKSLGLRPYNVASMTVIGPSPSNNAHCIKGASVCKVSKLLGVGLQPGRDYLQIMLGCGIAETTPPGFAQAARAVMGSDGAFVFKDTGNMAQEDPGVYKMCWCRSSPDRNCSQLSDFHVNAGEFIFHGPYELSKRSVPMGGSLRLEDVAGIMMSRNDSARLQLECGQDGEGGVDARVQANARTYDFGRLQSGAIPALAHKLCWCQASPSLGIHCDKPSDFGAYFGDVHVHCPERWVDLNQDGTCELCSFWWQEANRDHDHCETSVLRLIVMLIFFVSTTLAFQLFFDLVEVTGLLTGQLKNVRLHGRRIYIEDISPEGQGTVVTTASKHFLWSCHTIPVTLHDTGHYLLDYTPKQRQLFSVRVAGDSRLRLLYADGAPLQLKAPAGSSMGYVLLSLPRSFLHTCFYRMPQILIMVACVATTVGTTIWLEGNMTAFVPMCSGCMVIGLLISVARKWRTRRGTLEARLRLYDKMLLLKNPTPKPCGRGPHRAVTVGELFELMDFFGAFIKERTMYYLQPNILKPLTAPYKLSYAEVVGPQQVQWFVSHWWGTSFRNYCEALSEHSTSTCGSQEPDMWKTTSYYICTFSNNQHKVDEEIGKSHKESSFYLALHSGVCKGTCMILDEKAMPLTRSWCLFELLQTIQLERNTSFAGLLFCTRTGVLNYGASTVEMSMRIGDRLASLSLRDADASWPEDKEMINNLVLEEMGSFEKIDEELRSHISTALKACSDHVDEDFKQLFRKLGSGSAEVAAI